MKDAAVRTVRVLLGMPVRCTGRHPGVLLSLLQQGGSLSTALSVGPSAHGLMEHLLQPWHRGSAQGIFVDFQSDTGGNRREVKRKGRKRTTYFYFWPRWRRR